MNKSHINNKKHKKGAAIVEFAILTTVMVPLLLYISFFTELLQFRMKLDEMTYFATWEMASYNMSDYSENPNTNAKERFNQMKTNIKADTLRLYGNLDSADPDRSIGYLMITPDPASFNVTTTPERRNGDNDSSASNSNQESSNGSSGGGFNAFIGKIDGFINQGVNYLAGTAFGFNTNYIGNTTSVSGSFSITKRMNTKTMTRDTGGFTNAEMLRDDLATGNAVTIETVPFTIWVDTWALKNGENVNNTDSSRECLTGGSSLSDKCDGMPYAKQVQRMSLLGTGIPFLSRGVRALVKIVGSAGMAYLKNIPLIGGLFKDFEDPTEARMISINYYYNTDRIRGNYTNGDIDRGQQDFQTSPLVHIFRNGNAGNSDASAGIRAYRDTLRSRRNFYMGNNEPYCNFNGTSEDCEANTP